MSTSRRQFLASVSALIGTASLPIIPTKSIAKNTLISCNSYTWLTFYKRLGKTWMNDPDACFEEMVKAGVNAYEPAVTSANDVVKLGSYLKKYSIAMPSLYVNSSLHKPDDAQQSIKTILAIADVAKPFGTHIFVTNPNPIRWGSDTDKTDDELIEQAKNLDNLGNMLRQRGITLAYHTHAPEHRQAAREFHHMLLETDPKNVSFCLDAHWVYRGSGNSQVALFDVVKLYGKRIAEIHIRQSKNGIWQETCTDGDIDYRRLAATLTSQNVRPLLVLEQCLEKDTPNTIDVVEAHRQNVRYVTDIFL